MTKNDFWGLKKIKTSISQLDTDVCVNGDVSANVQ